MEVFFIHSVTGIEDEMNWHGKALGTKGVEVLETIKSQIVNNEDGSKLINSKIVEDCPNLPTEEVKLSKAPEYTVGQAVSLLISPEICLRVLND
jgi:hypothetical protein